MSETMRDRAVALAQQGFRVFRLQPGTKLPAVKRFYDVASNDPEVIHKEWTRADGSSRNDNIGISTDGMMVIDIDNKNGHSGEATFAKMVRDFDLNPITVESRTPTGGRHLFYKLPPGVEVPNSSGQFGPGVDIRGHHGYVVAPGSIVPAGSYERVDGWYTGGPTILKPVLNKNTH